MKHIPIIRFSFIVLLFSVPVVQARTCTGPVKIVCPAIDCNVNVVHISQADVGPGGFTISIPGRYCLIEDITFSPTASGTPAAPLAAITITTSNVQLDLNGYVLSGPLDPAIINTVGIKVGTGPLLSNVQILGGGSGSVQGFTLGIFVDPVDNVLIEDLSAISNGQTGSVIINGSSFVGGIAVVGTPVTNSQNVVLRRVNTSFNGGTPVALTSTFGTLLNWVTSATVENSQFDNNTSTFNGTNGLFMSQSNDIDVRDCQANDNEGLTLATGIRVDDNVAPANGRIQLSRNTANNTSISGTPGALPPLQNIFFVAGFYLRSANECTLIDCVANNTTEALNTNAGRSASGFELDQSSDCRLERCIAGDISGGTESTGFDIAGNRVTCVDCYAENYTSINSTAVGFALENFTNFGAEPVNTGIPSFDAIIGSKAYGSVSLGSATSTVGIELINANNCVLDGNLLIANAPDGIFVRSTASCISSGNIIKHNQIENISPGFFNQGATGLRGLWAIEDTTFTDIQAPLNTYYDNYAFDYPGDGVFPNMTNYNTGVRAAGNNALNPQNTYISQWSIPGDPPGPTGVTKLTNLDIIYATCVTGIDIG